MISWIEWIKSLFVLEFSKPSMPAPPPAPGDPTKTPEAIAARAKAEREAEIAASQGLERNMVAGRALSMEDAQKRASKALGY